MKKALLIILIAVIIIINFTPLSYLLKENYTYSNFDGSFQFQEEGGGGVNFTMVKRRFQRFLAENPEKEAKDNKIYRTFTIKPWYVWQWGDYIFQHERFSLPYKDRRTIIPIHH